MKSLIGEELRQFIVLHNDCFTSVEEGAKAFYMQLWAEYFINITEVLDVDTGVNTINMWRINGVLQDTMSNHSS